MEERLRAVLTSAVEGIIMIDQHGVVESVNPAAERMFGYSSAELLGHNVGILMPEPDRDRHNAYIENYLRTGISQVIGNRLEVAGRRKDGVLFPLELVVSEMCSGGRVAYAGFLEDISARKAAEREVLQQASQQAAVAELGRHALAGSDMRELLEEAVRTVANTLDLEFVKVLRLLPDGRGLLLEAGVGWNPGLVGNAVIPSGANSQAGFALISRQPVLVSDLSSETRFEDLALLRNHAVVSGMSVIIHHRHQPYGVLGAHSTRRREFTPDDINFLQAIANTLAIAIERARADDALHQSEARLRAVFRAIVEGVVFLNTKGEVEVANDAVDPAFGDSLHKLVEPVLNPGKPVVRADGSAFPVSEQPASIALRTGEAVRNVEMGVPIGDRDFRWRLINAQPVRDDNGRLLGAVASFYDITDRKRVEAALRASEERLRLAFEAGHSGSFEWDIRARRNRWSRELLALYGISQEQFCGTYKAWIDCVVPEDRKAATVAVQSALKTGELELEFRIRRCDTGAIRWMHARGRVSFDDAHRPIRLIGINIDITERRKLERELLEISHREQQRIGQDIHDDLCQWLTGIELHCHLLSKELSVAAPQLVPAVERIGAHLRSATERARSLARGLAPVAIQNDGLAAALRELAENAEQMFHISCRCDCSADLLAGNAAAALQLYRIAQEAISNAVRHGNATEVRISLGAERDRGVLCIRNNGTPLPRPMPTEQRMGVRTMRYRAELLRATLDIHDAERGGVEVICSFPKGCSS